ncbi:uncharacterized protein TRUGW13939_00773 [Talaromyces rugulosus]|uniref:Zn(2)-C6 fungal-type domain-containing protein n=1 Tax=Talaromyces rugulosus TaxID=121627 RepID=A0A7H8QKA8_TALRU|nr:uncharacterized protein TRUGW13939_00773 [Talaromyces rugulosus]QKX53693.1 hypothetical protein TRUGW13939_00773 [Talaromyces rugulosus]
MASSSSSSLSRRLPVSCENCRRRKIRCSGVDDRAPCETCVRRGYATTCTFKRESLPRTIAQNSELLKHISDLNALLKRNISITQTSLEQGRDTLSPLSVQAEPTEKDDTQDDTSIKVSPTGRLLTSTSKHVRCIPYNRVGDGVVLELMQEPTCSPLAGFAFSPAQQDLLGSLPAFENCDKLKEIFLNVFSPLFHILHEPTFEAKYRDFRRAPQSTPISFLALLFVIFSLAITSLDEHNPLVTEIGQGTALGAINARGLASHYRSAAMRCLFADDFLSQHNLCTLQSLVLLVYAMSHAGGSIWSLLGSALHIAIAIGCSVDPAKLGVGIIEAEERRRCWAGLMMLYTIQSTNFGNIMPFSVRADVLLPANVNDEELLDATSGSLQPKQQQKLTQMSYILSKFKLYNLAFDICRLSSSTPFPSRQLVMKLDEQLAVEVKKHMALFEDVPSLPFYHVAHFYIVNNYTHHLSLLLHRPYLGTIESASPLEPTQAHIHESRQRCNDSAMKILSNFESFHHNPHLKPYRWYIYGFGSFQAFLAMTTLLVIMAKGNISPTSKLAIQTAVNACMNIFRENSSVNETCAKALAVLEQCLQTQMAAGFEQNSLGESLFAMPPTPSPDDTFSNICGSFPQLETIIRDIPSENWLLPSGFPWAE